MKLNEKVISLLMTFALVISFTITSFAQTEQDSELANEKKIVNETSETQILNDDNTVNGAVGSQSVDQDKSGVIEKSLCSEESSGTTPTMDLFSNDSIEEIVSDAMENDQAEIVQAKNRKGVFQADTETSDVDIPKNPEDGISISTDSSLPIEIGLPEEITSDSDYKCINDTITYNDEAAPVAAAAQAISNSQGDLDYMGVREIIVIKNESAPREYSFDFELPKGGKLVMADSFKGGYEEDAGCVYVIDREGNIQYIIDAPWATDANGNEVATNYSINGNTLVQTVFFDKDSDFPIVADPACYEYWKIESTKNAGEHSSKWILGVKKNFNGKGKSTITANVGVTVSNSVSGSIQVSKAKILKSVGITASLSKSWSFNASDSEDLTGRKKGVYALYYKKLYTKYLVTQRKYIKNDGKTIKGKTTKVATVLKAKKAVHWSNLRKIG